MRSTVKKGRNYTEDTEIGHLAVRPVAYPDIASGVEGERAGFERETEQRHVGDRGKVRFSFFAIPPTRLSWLR